MDALVFDLDGVLWDSNSLHDRAFREVCIERSIDPLPYALLAGLTTPSAWMRIAHENGISTDMGEAEIRSLTARKREIFLTLARDAPVRDADLGLLSDRFGDIPWAIVTGASSETLESFLRRSKFRSRFSVLVTADAGLPSKPAPESYLVALARLGVAPARSVIFEDSESGLGAAQASGARVVHVTNQAGICERHGADDRWPRTACVRSPGDFVGIG